MEQRNYSSRAGVVVVILRNRMAIKKMAMSLTDLPSLFELVLRFESSPGGAYPKITGLRHQWPERY